MTIPGNRSGWRWRARGTSSSPGCSLINGLVYVALLDRRAGTSRATWRRRATSWRAIGRSIRDHLRFRHPTGEAAKRYNVLQKLAYLVVIFVLLPLIVLMGLAMSPWMNSVLPGWVDLLRRPAVGAHAAFRRRVAARRLRR